MPITTGEKVAFIHSAKKEKPSSPNGGEKEGGFGEAMRKWKERAEVGVEKEEKVQKVRKLVNKIEATTSRISKNRNGTSQGIVNN